MQTLATETLHFFLIDEEKSALTGFTGTVTSESIVKYYTKSVLRIIRSHVPLIGLFHYLQPKK